MPLKLVAIFVPLKLVAILYVQPVLEMSAATATATVAATPASATEATTDAAASNRTALEELGIMVVTLEKTIKDRSKEDKTTLGLIKDQIRKVYREMKSSKRKRNSAADDEDGAAKRPKRITYVTTKPALAKFLGVNESDVLSTDEVRTKGERAPASFPNSLLILLSFRKYSPTSAKRTSTPARHSMSAPNSAKCSDRPDLPFQAMCSGTGAFLVPLFPFSELIPSLSDSWLNLGRYLAEQCIKVPAPAEN